MADSNQVRINELARELEIKAKVLIDYLPEAGVTEKKTHSSSIDLKHAELVRKHFRGLAAAEEAEEAAKAAKATAAKRPAAKPATAAPAAPAAGARSLQLAGRLPLRRLRLGLVLRRTLPRPALQPLRELRDLPHLRARRRLIRQRTRRARRLRLRSPRHPHLRLLLPLQLYVPASRRPRLHRDLACRCGLQQHRELPPGRVRQQQRPALRALLPHLQHCNVIHRVPARLRQALGKHVPV